MFFLEFILEILFFLYHFLSQTTIFTLNFMELRFAPVKIL